MMKSLMRGLLFVAILPVLVWAADEITFNSYLSVKNGQFDLARNVSNLKITQNGNSGSYNLQAINTNGWEQITISSDVATNGVAWFRNLSTNAQDFVDVGILSLGGTNMFTNYHAFIRMYGTEVAGPLRLHPTNAIYATAGTTRTNQIISVNLEAWINED